MKKKRGDLADPARREEWAMRMQDAADREIDLDLLEKAFENPPNCYSGLALQFFMTELCFRLERKAGTGLSAYSAFKKYWENM